MRLVYGAIEQMTSVPRPPGDTLVTMTESDKKVIGDSDVILYEFLLRGQEVDKVCPWVPLVPARPKRGGD